MRRSGGIALLLLALCAACTHAPAPAVRPFDYMGALRDAEAQLAAAATQADKPPGQSANPMMAPEKSAALQQLGVARSWVGDAVGAQAAFDEAFDARPDDPEWLRLGQVEAGDILAQYPVEDALTAIVREASGRQI